MNYDDADDAKAGNAAFLTLSGEQVSTGFFKTFSPMILNYVVAVQPIYFKIGTRQIGTCKTGI